MPRVQKLFTKFVEVGRVCNINFGPLRDKLCVIVTIIDQNRVLVDGPPKFTGVHRQAINLKRLSLTNFKIKNLQRGATTKVLSKLFQEQGILQKWNNSGLAQKIKSQEVRANLNDFQRFLVNAAKRRRSRNVQAEFLKLVKSRKASLAKKSSFGRVRKTAGKPKALTKPKTQTKTGAKPKSKGGKVSKFDDEDMPKKKGGKSGGVKKGKTSGTTETNNVVEEPIDTDKKELLLTSFVSESSSSKVEIVFSFDTTGSMASCLGKVREKVSETVTRLIQDIKDIRIGIIAHGDYCDDVSKYAIKKIDLTNNVKEICDFVNTVEATGVVMHLNAMN